MHIASDDVDENPFDIGLSGTGANLAPTVASLGVTSGAVGASLTINGTNFSTTPGDNIVWFGGVQGTVTAATATEVGATGVKRQPWANAPFIPGPLADYMRSQFTFFNSSDFSKAGQPILAGLNYFLTHEARGGSGKSRFQRQDRSER